MSAIYTVLLSELEKEFHLDFFHRSTDYEKIHITVDDVGTALGDLRRAGRLGSETDFKTVY